ncbi:MAG TPA: hypothetical protein VK597_08385, partial [Inquilinus sp.]|nr:hypothetical protein [Inquilinus sp.]
RLTGSFKLPTVLTMLKPVIPMLQRILPFDLSLEFRGQIKIDPPGKSKDTPRGVSKAVQDSELTLSTYSDADGPRQLAVPGWLDTFLKWSEQGQGVLFPEGGVHAMKQYVDDLEGQATTPQQRQDIDAFRQEFLTPKEPDSKKTRLDNETLTTPATAQAIRDFLESQAKPVGTSTPADPMPLWNQRRQAGGTP